MKILLLIVRFQEYLEEDSYKEVEDLAGRLQAYKGNKIPLVVLWIDDNKVMSYIKCRRDIILYDCSKISVKSSMYMYIYY